MIQNEFFLMKLEGPRPLQEFYWKVKRVYKILQKETKRDKENVITNENYNIFWTHKSKIAEYLAIALNESNFISFLKLDLTDSKMWCILLKMKSFLVFQMAQVINMATIMKNLG